MSKKWRAEKGGQYWIVDPTGEIGNLTDTRTLVDDVIYNFGNYFQTQKEAEEARERIRRALQEE